MKNCSYQLTAGLYVLRSKYAREAPIQAFTLSMHMETPISLAVESRVELRVGTYLRSVT